MSKTALVTGISGQDGSYLAEHLLSLGYRVCGILRRHSVAENQDYRLRHIEREIETFYGDMMAPTSLQHVIEQVQPDEIYNLAGQSHVRISFDMAEFTAQVNGMGVLRLLEICRRSAPQARIYQASSSEMFGLSCDGDGCQRETTPMTPTSPYGCAKHFAYDCVRHARRAHGMFASNGILFNHESPRRGSNFVTAKVIRGALAIKHGLAKELLLGNIDSERDWGHSRDYVKAMHLILQHDNPDDFVIATGQTRSVRTLCVQVFSRLGLNYLDYVRQDERFMRAEELPYLCGDASKAKKILGWTPTISFEELIDEMLDAFEKEITDGTNRIAG
jgi:GDPmannose 4,6-dehydratase